MIYYVLVLIAVLLFGGQFFFNGIYEKHCGSSLYATFVFSLITGAIGAAVLFAVGGFTLHITVFTAVIAALTAINTILYSFFAIKSLGLINLSLFSVFAMIGGMALPFVMGILFYGEPLTVAKVICFVLISVALAFTVDQSGKKGGWIYYLGVFVTNGMSGVYSTVFTKTDAPKATVADMQMLAAIFRVVLAGAVLLVLCCGKKKHGKFRFTKPVWLSLALCGVLTIVGNYLVTFALEHIPASMNYPLVTGGVMIVSTVIGFFTAAKPRKKDVLAVLIAFAGMAALLLPI